MGEIVASNGALHPAMTEADGARMAYEPRRPYRFMPPRPPALGRRSCWAMAGCAAATVAYCRGLYFVAEEAVWPIAGRPVAT